MIFKYLRGRNVILRNEIVYLMNVVKQRDSNERSKALLRDSFWYKCNSNYSSNQKVVNSKYNIKIIL